MGWVKRLIDRARPWLKPREWPADFALWRATRNEKAAARWLRVWRRFRQKIRG